MNSLFFDINLATLYKSKSQTIRVQSEDWLQNNMYCPCCGNIRLKKFENNKPVADFYCERCSEQFELKSAGKVIKNKIVDGAFETAINRVKSNSNPSLFLLQYEKLFVRNLTLVPKNFFTPNIIEKRKPLSLTARRAGWIGSNILFSEIPEQGKVKIISEGEIVPVDIVLCEYKKTQRLFVGNIEFRGWLFDVLNCINSIESDIFSLGDIYAFEPLLKSRHPDNNNVKDKIRQQLQFLRDRGIIEFIDNKGHYKKIK